MAIRGSKIGLKLGKKMAPRGGRGWKMEDS